MKTPHVHADIIKAWADGEQIEHFNQFTNQWGPIGSEPCWFPSIQFRIKPEPKPDVMLLRRVDLQCRPSNTFPSGYLSVGVWDNQNLKLTFDGETGKLKSAEVL